MFRDCNLLRYYLSLYYWADRGSECIGEDEVVTRASINLLRSHRVLVAIDDKSRAFGWEIWLSHTNSCCKSLCNVEYELEYS